jgi:hypothetical protein
MAGFLYFLPGKKTVRIADLNEAGLGYAFEKPSVASRETLEGPGGLAGAVAASEKDMGDARIGYFPEEQTWRKIPGLEAWVGFYTKIPPGPGDLERADALRGHLVRLGDGREWTAPVARGWSDSDPARWYNALPSVSTLDDQGNWTPGGTSPRYKALWALAESWWDAFCAAQADGAAAQESHAVLAFEGIHNAALYALAANYRLGKAEVALLGLFDDANTVAIMHALIDWPTFKEWVKKNEERAGLNSGAGS